MDAWALLQQHESGSASTDTALREALAAALNKMILDDFAGLVQLLYRVDVSEQKLKKVLQENRGTDAGEMLADLLLQRQAEKRKHQGRPSSGEASDEERW